MCCEKQAFDGRIYLATFECSILAADYGFTYFDVETWNCLYTTYVPGRVLYPVEQFPRCDLLILSPRLGDSSCRFDETPLLNAYTFSLNILCFRHCKV